MIQWHQEFRTPQELYEDSADNNELSTEKRSLLVSSIKENGLDQLICASADGLILWGIERFHILKNQGVEFIAVYVPHGDPPNEAVASPQISPHQDLGDWDNDLLQKEIEQIVGVECSSDGMVTLDGADTSESENAVRDIIKNIEWSDPDKSERKIDRYMVTLAFDFEKEADQVIKDIAPIVYRYKGATIRKRCRYFSENRQPKRKKWI